MLRPFDSIIGVSGILGRPPPHPGKPHEENIFGKPEFQRSFYQASLDAPLRSLPVRRLTSTIRPPILAPCQRHNDTTRCKVRIVLALAVLAASVSSACAAPPTGGPFPMPLLCTRSGEKILGLTKISFYSCAKSEGAMTATTYEDCPRWTARWQLNQSAQFGPNENPQ